MGNGLARVAAIAAFTLPAPAVAEASPNLGQERAQSDVPTIDQVYSCASYIGGRYVPLVTECRSPDLRQEVGVLNEQTILGAVRDIRADASDCASANDTIEKLEDHMQATFLEQHLPGAREATLREKITPRTVERVVAGSFAAYLLLVACVGISRLRRPRYSKSPAEPAQVPELQVVVNVP